ncbi:MULTISPECIES: hemerythrin domain-containing protein [Vibrio]|uniref:Hemerythrin n=3 Tax=Vibrio cyclitrophicus TaxID=47951 RepID=A0A7Z1MEW0_9VIBR|nr:MULTISPECIES: hemerythrin domain-containing protein [Vibrio]KNH11506.1 hemerythrin [Vibrio lentus]MBE8558262.1 hemerythrin domain-containing protein [Vibrio sp. OPT24]MCC4772474.1 hemerythrin domain-containing protein [Vibrio cyclitrophicus]MCC4843165.1 hemerythrin domain-containing protein [Vibrio cyclitrophicus]OCH39784.1 hemerythrin [Vibrio cyclitrophicus]|tara:strand:+ start:8774 stop:9202 length:429 start_codon:yes stop_codon:yes gene_type:complete
MKNIFDVLKDSHEKQRLLMDALLQTSGDTQARQELYVNLKNELTKHAIAEERHFYAPLIESDQSIDMTRHGIAEHHGIDKILAQLDDTEMSSPAWLVLMKTLKDKVEHHLEEEEQRFFQTAGRVLDTEQKETLARKYEKEVA